jgi:hypothetical protein
VVLSLTYLGIFSSFQINLGMFCAKINFAMKRFFFCVLIEWSGNTTLAVAASILVLAQSDSNFQTFS